MHTSADVENLCKFGTGVHNSWEPNLMACQEPLCACEWSIVQFSGGMGDKCLSKIKTLFTTYTAVIDILIPRLQYTTQCG